MNIQNLSELELIEDQIEEAEKVVLELKEQEYALKATILEELLSENIKSITSPSHKYQISAVSRTDQILINKDELIEYARSNGLELFCETLDTVKAKKMAKSMHLPGIRAVQSTSLRMSLNKVEESNIKELRERVRNAQA